MPKLTYEKPTLTHLGHIEDVEWHSQSNVPPEVLRFVQKMYRKLRPKDTHVHDWQDETPTVQRCLSCPRRRFKVLPPK